MQDLPGTLIQSCPAILTASLPTLADTPPTRPAAHPPTHKPTGERKDGVVCEDAERLAQPLQHGTAQRPVELVEEAGGHAPDGGTRRWGTAADVCGVRVAARQTTHTVQAGPAMLLNPRNILLPATVVPT